MKFEFPKDNNLYSLKNEKETKWEMKEKEIEKIRDVCGEKIDEGIKETVIALNLLELPTRSSCEGHLDHGISAPWVEISAPNEPEERFIGENKIFQEIAKKYNLSLEEVKKGNDLKIYFEAFRKASKNKETLEYKKWRKENKKLKEKAKILLNEFYKNREVPQNIKLKITEYDSGIFRIHNGGKDYKPIFEDEFKKLSDRKKEELSKRLQRYQEEMKEFAKFLKKKYFK